ncbi:putative membrane protein [Solibacillus kalamii]|uniref:ATPase n=1 Tax=Solibacillus kalamii TaxID=1748298 RepID=A0ABX3ZKX6_9BACL|nr:ATPase [Solibacillus kalamii]MBM7665217.1 putative membrane protein [Solibacillus kalamii]OUZ40423.1 ATPase [Solibacillus kalamii]
MKKMLLHYYEQGLASWLLFTPLVASFFALPLLFEGAEMAAYFILSISITALCAVYLDQRENQLVMTSLFPISRKTFFIVDLSFLGRYTLYYILYTIIATTSIQTLLEQQLVLPSVRQLLVSFAISFFIIAFFLLFRRSKFGQMINFSIFLIPLGFSQLLVFLGSLSTFQSFSLFMSLLILLIIAASITYFREYWRDVP